MDIRAIAFDVNGTLVNIRTDEHLDEAFRTIGHLLTYQGIDLRRHEVRDLYFAILKRQQRGSAEKYPEFDSVGVWRTLVEETATDYTRALPPEKLAQLPGLLAETYRGATRRRLKLYPHVRTVLQGIHGGLPMAIVTDGQSSYARGELHKVGIAGYFGPIVVSGDHGYRKPDPRLFQLALSGMGVAAEHTLYVGNDMHRDVYGAQQLGMKTVMFASDQGTKSYRHCVPDHTIHDHRELLGLLGL
ncbi:HAD family hydrolase [Subtercola sp. PAMC28395]|uniref:HAD family hydrolase n=1 Tax=Subtercola sp. PAMC28395 TaxID=2846775 RepID=UPI001C0DD385|nr:HAD family hydrolase [Subtercola sp. PAMC28395]QWT24480.1 HAD family hydrolase [Subtercola sp. PAMC28395]